MKLNQPKGKELIIKDKKDKTDDKRAQKSWSKSKFIPVTKNSRYDYY